MVEPVPAGRTPLRPDDAGGPELGEELLEHGDRRLGGRGELLELVQVAAVGERQRQHRSGGVVGAAVDPHGFEVPTPRVQAALTRFTQ